MSIDARPSLADQQAALVAALTNPGETPPGFIAPNFQAAAVALTHKRARSVAHAWPGLFQSLSESGEELFTSYAQATPLPRVGGALADGRFFAQWLAARGLLPAAVRRAVLAIDLRYLKKLDGLFPRKWPSMKIALLGRRLVIGIRIPRLGEYWLPWPT